MTRQPFSPPSRKLPGWFYESKPAQEIITKAFVQASRERAIEFILKALELRFDPDEVRQLTARIAGIKDVQRLKQLHCAAIQASDLEEFRRLLDDMTTV